MRKLSDLQAKADACALQIDAKALTYGQLRQHIAARAAGMPKASPQIWLLPMKRDLDTIVQLYACLQTDRIVMPMPAKATLAQQEAAASQFAQAWLYSAARPAGSDGPAQSWPAGTWLIANTSGTGGTPKAYVRDHASWLASIAAFAPRQPQGQRVACLTPLHYSLGLYALMQNLYLGKTVVLKPTHLFECQHVDVAYAVPSFVREYLQQPAQRFAPHLVLSGEPVAADLIDRYQARHPTRRCLQFYGSSETSFITVDDRVLPGVSVRLVHHEIQVASPQHFSGYYQNGHLTPAPEWLATGDCGHWQNGRLLVDGRLDSRINRGGEKCFPEQIERLLRQHPQIQDARVFAVPSPRLGQAIHAAIVWRGTPCPRAALNAWLAAHSAQKLVLDAVQSRAHLPLAASGKQQRLEGRS